LLACFYPFLGSKGKYFIIEIAPYGRFIVKTAPIGSDKYVLSVPGPEVSWLLVDAGVLFTTPCCAFRLGYLRPIHLY
jgi:hypothetical protein